MSYNLELTSEQKPIMGDQMHYHAPADRQVNTCLIFLATFTLSLSISAFCASDSVPQAATTKKQHAGLPMDWSSRHLVMAGDSVANAIEAGDLEPRHVYNLARRMQAFDNLHRRPVRHPGRSRAKIDWAVSLENGYMPANQYPAKYRFDIGAEDCNTDYVIFTLTLASGNGANLVGINNLYTEATPKCNSGTPWVSFAYNTKTNNGQNRTSPVLSLVGDKVAFVESTNGASYFHVLVLPNPIPAPPSHTGTVISPATPTTCANPITAGCMSTVQISTGANTLSSPWVDYASDTAYVGTNDGKLYKIKPVFGGGAPAVVNDADWPVNVTSGTSKVLTAPVVDNNPGVNRIFIGDGNGYLYAVKLGGAGHATAATLTIGWAGHGAGTAIVDPPVVVTDVANPAMDQVFAFTGCSNVLGIGASINQVPANFTSSSTYVAVDMGSSDGQGSCTTGNAHGAAFDDAFWASGSTYGHIMGCGFVSGSSTSPLIPSNPKMYKFAFDASHNVTATGAQTWVINNTRGDECSPLTEFSDGTNDRVFFGAGGTTDAFIESSNLTNGFLAPTLCTSGNPNSTCSTAPAGLGGTSGISVDNTVGNGGMNIYFSTVGRGSVNGQNCHVSGGAATPYCAVKLTQSGLN
jgi:hypothetical protein